MSTNGARSSGRLTRWALLFAFIGIAYVWATALSLDDSIFLAPVLSIATLVTGFAVWGVQDAGEERMAIERARQGLLPLDGEKGAAIGPIVPLTDEIPVAPFSGRKAVAYIYRVYRKERTRTSRGGSIEYDVAAYVGRAVALSEVRTAAGPVRVLGMPLLEVDKEVLSGWEALGKARDFLSRTAFQDKEHEIGQGGTEVVLSTRAFDPGASGLREDFRYAEISDLSDWQLEETVVSPGQEVSAFGWYSESLGALTCSRAGASETESVGDLLLRPGGLAAAANAQRRHSGCAKLVGVLALAVQLAAIAAFCGRGRSKEGDVSGTGGASTMAFAKAAKIGEPRFVKQLIEAKVDLYATAENGRTAAHLARNAETMELVLRAAALADVRDSYGDTPLMWHAFSNAPDLVRVLSENGAKLDAEDHAGFTAIQMTDSAEIRKILLAAGARDPDAEIAAGEPLPESGGDPWKVVLAELDARRRGDGPAAEALWARGEGTSLAETGLRKYSRRPETVRFLSGHVLGDKARVEGVGWIQESGMQRLVCYLVREEGKWKLLVTRVRS